LGAKFLTLSGKMSLSIFLFVGEIFYRYLVDNERKKQTPKFRDSAGWTNKHSKLKKLSADFFLFEKKFILLKV